MTEEATLIIEWTSTTGKHFSLLLVNDTDLHGNSSKSERFELCSKEDMNAEWKTEEVLDYVNEIESFGIPEDYFD